jgi:hypothetical protein
MMMPPVNTGIAPSRGVRVVRRSGDAPGKGVVCSPDYTGKVKKRQQLKFIKALF